MKVLFITEIYDWSCYEHVLGLEKPDVLLIGIGAIHRHPTNIVSKELGEVIFKPMKATWKKAEFLYKLSIVKFYTALEYASRTCNVFVMSDTRDLEEFWHSKDASSSNPYSFFKTPVYDRDRINAIHNCKEISGTMVDLNGLKLLGLAQLDIKYIKRLKDILKNVEDKSPDIIVAGGWRSEIFESFRCKLFISGSSFGSLPRKFMHNGTWIVRGGYFPETYTIITTKANQVDNIEFKSARLLHGWNGFY